MNILKYLFYIANNELTDKEIRKTILFTATSLKNTQGST